MIDWLIIGGGIQGTALSHYLTRKKGLNREHVRVLDPYPQPLARWHATTRNTGMTHLRSPEVHHLHFDPWSIRTFAQTQQGRPYASYIPIFNRPSLALFNAYSDWLIARYALDGLRIQGRAQALTWARTHDCWRVETERGQLTAKNVVLAINTTESPFWPGWATALKASGAAIHHIFDLGFVRGALPPWEHAVIIGGGISAAQTALAMAHQQPGSRTQPGSVTMLSRHALRQSHFDSDPCWVTNICLADFHKISDFDQRRKIIRAARQPGSLPPDVTRDLKQAADTALLRLQFGEIASAEMLADGSAGLTLMDGSVLRSDCVILATGFEARRPGGAWLDATIAAFGLPVADCGYPIVDQRLRWHEGLYVVGRLAELEIGPVAANIIGSRLSAGRFQGI